MNTQLHTTTDYDNEYEDDTDVEPSITVTIDYDRYADSPDDCMDDLKIYSFNSRHIKYKDPDTFFTHRSYLGYDVAREGPSLGFRRKLECGTAVILSCYEHSGVMWSLRGEGMRCRFDTADVAGIMIWEGKPKDIGDNYTERMEFFRSVLREYNDWCNGNMYMFQIYDVTDADAFDDCWYGSMSSDGVIEELRLQLKDIPSEEIQYEGDAKWIADYI